jgi:hypothetical protein
MASSGAPRNAATFCPRANSPPEPALRLELCLCGCCFCDEPAAQEILNRSGYLSVMRLQCEVACVIEIYFRFGVVAFDCLRSRRQKEWVAGRWHVEFWQGPPAAGSVGWNGGGARGALGDAYASREIARRPSRLGAGRRHPARHRRRIQSASGRASYTQPADHAGTSYATDLVQITRAARSVRAHRVHQVSVKSKVPRTTIKGCVSKLVYHRKADPAMIWNAGV